MRSQGCGGSVRAADPEGTFVSLGLLIVEGRPTMVKKEPSAKVVHHHYMAADQSNKATSHVCSRNNVQCCRAKQIRGELTELWRQRIPAEICVFLSPDRCPVCNDSRSVLLEKWTIKCAKKNKQSSGQVLPEQFLMQAVHSYLHFSQLSAWLVEADGRLPFVIAYEVNIMGERNFADALELNGLPVKYEEHRFPECEVDDGAVITVNALTLCRGLQPFSFDCPCSRQSTSRVHSLDPKGSTKVRTKLLEPKEPLIGHPAVKSHSLSRCKRDRSGQDEDPLEPNIASAENEPTNDAAAPQDDPNDGVVSSTMTDGGHGEAAGGVDLDESDVPTSGPRLKLRPSTKAQDGFKHQRLCQSVCFNKRTGLPLCSSPDAESASSDSDSGTSLCKSAPERMNLLGSFEESALKGRIKPFGVLEGFTIDLAASGAFYPPHVVLPVTTFFYNLKEDAPLPYFGHCSLEQLGRKGYHVPLKGTIQVTLFNPQGSVVKMFIVQYKLTDMPPCCQTFVRQRTYFMPANATRQDALEHRSWLHYLIHLRFASSKSRKIYLHSDVRMLFARKSELDVMGCSGDPTGQCCSSSSEQEWGSFELRSFNEMPRNPKFSPRKLNRADWAHCSADAV